jgi:predicted helicase
VLAAMKAGDVLLFSTFITRLLRSSLMTPAQIRKKYQGQIHANGMALLS